MSSNYADAVAFATDHLDTIGYSNNSKSMRAEPTEYLYVYGLQIKQNFDNHDRCGTSYTYPENAFMFLFMKAEVDKGAFDIASRIVTTKLLRGETMSVEERVFSGMVIGGMKKCPKSEGKRIAENFAKNVSLVYLAEQLVGRYGLNLTRNNESSTNVSACDAVSDALENLGIHKSADAIKNLLVHKSSKRVREIVDASAEFIEHSQKFPHDPALLRSWVGDD